MKATLEKYKLVVDKSKLVAALAGIFLSGIIVATLGSSIYFGAERERITGAYERQIERLQTIGVQLNTANTATLAILVNEIQDLARDMNTLSNKLTTVNRGTTKAAEKVQEAAKEVVQAKALAPEIKAPVAPPDKPVQSNNQPVLPYQDRRIEY